MTVTYGPLTAASRKGGGNSGSSGRRSFLKSASHNTIQRMAHKIKEWRHLRTFILCVFCLVIVLDSLLTPNLEPVVDFVRDNGSIKWDDDDGLENDQRGFILDIEAQSFMEELDDSLLELSEGFGGDDYDLNYMTAQQRYAMGIKSTQNIDGNNIFHNLIDSKMSLPPYSIQDAIFASQIYYDSVAILIYDANDDKFVLLYSRRHAWNSASRKLIVTFQNLAYLLRKLFPERFQGIQNGSKEFVIPIASGDYPHVKSSDCLRNLRSDQPCAEPFMTKAPILHFGSIFSNMNMYPNIIAMPMPERSHLLCFREWANNQRLCKDLRERLDYGDDLEDKSFYNLWPQVIWRGTDFGYLGNIYPDWEQPKYGDLSKDFRGRIPRNRFGKLRAALASLEENYSKLVPRWQGVVLTAKAFRDAERARADGARIIPWVNIKFSNFVDENGHKSATRGSVAYREWEEIGMPVAGEYIDLKQSAKYKYHIDLAGGGGTTWTGTMQKLALPGLLFHHVTPTKDYIHDYMEPWVHYIPVASDLRDLKTKFDWAESHPDESKNIADRGTELIKYLTSIDGFQHMFNEDLMEPLRKVIEAYQPTVNAFNNPNWRRIVDEMDGQTIKPIMKCYGRRNGDCEQLVGSKVFGGNIARRYGALIQGGEEESE